MHQGTLLFRESGWVVRKCEERWEFGDRWEPRFATFSPLLTPFLHACDACPHSREKPSFGSALAGGVFGDTLLQQTSMMVEHRRPASRLGGAYSFRKPCYNYHPHPHESGRRRALVEFPISGKKTCIKTYQPAAKNGSGVLGHTSSRADKS